MADNERITNASGDTLAYKGRKLDEGALKAGEQSTTAGKNLGAQGKGVSGVPKQEPGEDLGAYMERVRKYRSGGGEEAEGQRKALGRMK